MQATLELALAKLLKGAAAVWGTTYPPGLHTLTVLVLLTRLDCVHYYQESLHRQYLCNSSLSR